MEENELRAAAERLLDAYEAGQRGEPVAVSAARIYGDGDITAAAESGERDMLAVIRWCHSELDQTPIDEAWLRSVGGSKDDHPHKWTFHREDAMSIGLWIVDDGWKAMLIHSEHAASCIVRGLKTRADFRRLASALGIPLQPAN